MNKYSKFSSDTKVADMILQNYTLLPVLPRFGVKLGFGEETISKLCERYGLDEIFFLLICNLHTFDNYSPSDKELNSISLGSVVEYLRSSHDYYKNQRIKDIERKLVTMESNSHSKHYKILNKFFAEYKQEILNHFEYEEQTVFPYVGGLAEGNAPEEFHIDQYEENHSNIDDKLNDLKNIIIKYLPEELSSGERFDILTDIFLFEDDLAKHTRIEDKILTPLVKIVEKNYEE